LNALEKVALEQNKITPKFFEFFNTEDAFYIVTEYVSCCTLYDFLFIQRDTRLLEPEAHLIFKKIAELLVCLREKQLAHRSLHVDNLVLVFLDLKLSPEELNKEDILSILD
jgi:serine/threonine protein kinase